MSLPEPYPIRQTRRLTFRPGETYHRFGSRETCLSRDEHWGTWLPEHGTKGFVSIPNGRVYDYYVEERSFFQLMNRLAEQLRRDWSGHVRRYPTQKKRLVQSAWAVSRAAGRLRLNSFINVYHRYRREAYDFDEYIWGAWAVIYDVEPVIIKAFPEQVETIMALDRPIDYTAMLRGAFRFSAAKVANRYGWLNMYNPHDRPFSAANIERLKRKHSRREVAEQFAKFRTNGQRYRSFRRSISDPTLQRYADMVHTYAWLKTDRIDGWRQSMQGLTGFFQWLTRFGRGLTIQETVNLSASEIIAALKGQPLPDRDHLRKRSHLNVMYLFRRGNITEVNDLVSIRSTLRRLQGTTSTKEVKGVTACPGQARGRVKIVRHSSDLPKMKPGDIFVATFTYPTFTPTMRKAAAIVTDEGGITSHAAIISREYGIPCVIGTGNATHILKDGDRVEVDATKGIVRKV